MFAPKKDEGDTIMMRKSDAQLISEANDIAMELGLPLLPG